MKKLLSYLIIFVLMAMPTWGYAASYYGCASAAINADSTFCATPSGSCAGSDAVTAATALAGTHTLYANGCTITIPNDANVTVTAAKLSNKDDGGDMVDGGQFTYVTSASYALALNADLETGGTTGAVLAISGNAAGTARVTITTASAGIVAGTASSMMGVSDTHTVGGVVVDATNGGITGGSNVGAYGYAWSGGTGTLEITGNATGLTGYGVSITGSGTGTASLIGDCIGSNTAVAVGCYGSNTVILTVTGNIINNDRAWGASGSVRWNPTPPSSGVNGHYIKIDGGGTPLYVGKNTETTSKALTDFYYFTAASATSTVGTATTTGGGAWGW